MSSYALSVARIQNEKDPIVAVDLAYDAAYMAASLLRSLAEKHSGEKNPEIEKVYLDMRAAAIKLQSLAENAVNESKKETPQ